MRISRLKGTFAKHTSTLFASSLVSTGISFVSLIVLARFFSPEVLGALYVFTATIAIISMATLAGYQHAVPLMSDEEVGQLVSIAPVIAMVMSIIAIPFLFFSGYVIIAFLYLVLNVPGQLGEMILIRDRQIKRISILRIMAPASAFFASLVSFSIYGDEIVPLLMFQLVAALIMATIYSVVVLFPYLNKRNKAVGLQLLRKYVRFAKYIAPGHLMHTLAYSLPIIVAGNFFNSTVAAQYNVAYRFVFAPVQLMSNAVSQVFSSRLSMRHRSGESLLEGYVRLRNALVLIATGACAVIGFLFPKLLIVLFDQRWHEATKYFLPLLPLAFAMLSISPLATIFQFTENQRYVFFVHLTSAIISGIAFSFAVYHNNFLAGVAIFSLAMFLRYGFILRQLEFVRKRNKAVQSK